VVSRVTSVSSRSLGRLLTWDLSKASHNVVGLCETCRHVRIIRSDRGTVFYLCTLSFTDQRFRKYPALPVIHCAGYEPANGA
jgi:hypothetical protein